jgi:hypothetical protein
MDTTLGLISKAVAPTNIVRRLTNDYVKGARLCQQETWSLEFRLRRNVMLVMLVFWAATCSAQVAVTQAVAQPANSPAIAVAPATTHTLATVPSMSLPFSRTVSSAKPHLVISMVEKTGPGENRSIPRITTISSFENSTPAGLAIDRPSSITTYGSQIVSARDSVRQYRQGDHVAAANIVNGASVNTQQTFTAPDATRPKHSPLAWLKQPYLASWPERFDISGEHATRQIDHSLSIEERLTHFEPLMIVSVGSGSLPVSLYVPALR